MKTEAIASEMRGKQMHEQICMSGNEAESYPLLIDRQGRPEANNI